jgi:hypothetical protein
MACPSGCGGFIDDEIWLIDTSSANCTTNQFGVFWVEVGTITTGRQQPGRTSGADGRPGTGNTLNVHHLGGTDPVGTVDHYMIVKDGRVSPNTHLVPFATTQSTLYNGTSSVQAPADAQLSASDGCQAHRHRAGAPLVRLLIPKGCIRWPGPFHAKHPGRSGVDAAYFWYNAQIVANTPNSANPSHRCQAKNLPCPARPRAV